MLNNTLMRRLITIPSVVVALVVFTLALPVSMTVGALIDVARWMRQRIPAMSLRIIGFAWAYLAGEVWALIVMGIAAMRGNEAAIDATYRLQKMWLDWNFDMLRLMFGLSFSVEGSGQVPPGPLLLLSRHASLIDTLLPGRFVVKPLDIKLRYILKRELLIDPALDVGGNRLPNYFIDRAGDTADELEGIRRLARPIGAHSAVLLYPEGTRYSEQKRLRFTERVRDQGERIASIAATFTRVLPPRPGGVLALLEATDADVVILAHRGLEGFASVADIWSGGLVGSNIAIEFWRIPRSQIPLQRQDRVEWLFETWSEVDAWVNRRPLHRQGD